MNLLIWFVVKESCLILLQTIPASIDIEVFKADLLKSFDDIASVHDLHIWQMTSSKYVSTAHIVFENPMVRIFELIVKFAIKLKESVCVEMWSLSISMNCFHCLQKLNDLNLFNFIDIVRPQQQTGVREH